MKIGFAGLGIMGTAMVGHLLAEHGALTVWNRDPAKTGSLAAGGARVAATASDLGRTCEVVHLSLLDTEAVRSVVFGPEGVLSDPEGGGTIIDHSTIDVTATHQFAEMAAARGWQWVDAPVSGGRAGAEEARLVVFIGAELETVERIRKAVAPFSRLASHMGPVGAGQATKAVNQLLVGGTFALLAEAAVLAERNGVSTDRLPDVLKGGFADSTLLQQQLPRMVAGPATLHGAAEVMLKDMNLVAELAAASGAATPVSAAARRLWQQHKDRGHGAEDWVTIIEQIRAAGGPTIEGGDKQ